MFFYSIYKIGYIIANILPLRFAYWLAERFSDIQFCVVKKDKEAVAQNLSRVLGKDIKECRILAQKVFRNFGLYLVDFFRMRRLDKKIIEEKVQVEGVENLDAALKKNRGAIALSCHIGNWEMGGVVIAMLGYDISAVALNHSHKNINDFFIRQREEKGFKVIRMNSVMKRCVSTLRKNAILALMGDRDFTGTGITLDFFGVPTSIPKGPAMLSLRNGSPVVPVFFIREKRFKYKLIFDKPIELKKMPGLGDDEIIKRATEGFMPIMEKYIRAYPEQWLVFRKFWEAPVDAFVL